MDQELIPTDAGPTGAPARRLWLTLGGTLLALAASAALGWMWELSFLLALLPIVGLRPLPAPLERVGWGWMTAGLSLTYATVGGLEWLVGAAVLASAAIGWRWAPWLLGVTWLAHAAWDASQWGLRGLAYPLDELEAACVVMDTVIGSYVAWRYSFGARGLASPERTGRD